LVKYEDKIQFREAWLEISYRQNNINVPSVSDIVEDIRKLVASGKTKIIFDCSGESLLLSVLKIIHIIVDKLPEIDTKDIFYITSALNGQEAYDQYTDSINRTTRKINILSRSTFESSILGWLETMPCRDSDNIPKENPFTYKLGLKEKNFVFLNRIMRGHRLKLITKIIKNGLIDKCFCSAGYPEDWKERLSWLVSDHPEIKDEVEEILKITKILPLKLNMSSERDNPIDLLYDDIYYHTNSYFSLVTETQFYNNSTTKLQYFSKSNCVDNTVFLTEKIFRPIAFKHPFVLCCTSGSLEQLRKLGYKTFHPYIDETYDTIIDDEERLEAVYKETERLCSFTDEQWLEWQLNITSIIEYNYLVLISKTPKDTAITKNIDELFDR